MQSAIRLLLAAAGFLAAAGASATMTVDLVSEPVHKLIGLNPGDELGWSLAVGDVDGDGSLDLAAGAPGANAHSGAVYVLDSDEFSSRGATVWDLSALRIEHHEPASRFGSSLLFMDVDGDGNDELIVGAPESSPDGEIHTGRIFVFDLPGLSAELSSDDALTIVTGSASGDGFGSDLESCDVDGDGVPELLVSAPGADVAGRPDAGAVYIIRPPLGALGSARRAHDVAAAAMGGATRGDALGTVRAADIDGDGNIEIILGANRFDAPDAGGAEGARIEDAGAVYVVPARTVAGRFTQAPSAGRRAGALNIIAVEDVATARTLGADERGFLGRAIAAGDVDSDGADDLLISAHTAGTDGDRLCSTGAAFLVFGDRMKVALPAGLDSESDRLSRNGDVVTFRGRSMWDIFGLSPIIADLNRDGVADIAISGQFVNGFEGERERSGEVYVYWGSLRSVMRAKGGPADRADVVMVGAAGDAVASALVSMDVTGNGWPELVIGAPEASGLDEKGSRRGMLYIVPSEVLRAR
jgi:hypothetical protein